MLRAMSVLVRYEGVRDGSAAAQRSHVARCAKRMLRALTLDTAELSVLLCDDTLMRSLNLAHRKLDRPTDVLAFAMNEGQPLVAVHATLGDIVIALPTARRQAATHGWSIELEICLLLAHGLLHLLGYDHANRADERRMMARAHLLMAAGLAGCAGAWTSSLPAAHPPATTALRKTRGRS
jgi:probable rRNA maturation factor